MYISKIDSLELAEVKSQAILSVATLGTFITKKGYDDVKEVVESNLKVINDALATGYWATHPVELAILRECKYLNYQALRGAEIIAAESKKHDKVRFNS